MYRIDYEAIQKIKLNYIFLKPLTIHQKSLFQLFSTKFHFYLQQKQFPFCAVGGFNKITFVYLNQCYKPR